jgi:recombination associated protein RdgC
MFKTLLIFRTNPEWAPSIDEVEEALQRQRYIPCTDSQEKAAGWVEPRGETHGPLVEAISGHRILKFHVESRRVPTSEVNTKAQVAADQIEETTGRKPGKREMKQLREDAHHALLPQAFSRHGTVWVWLDVKQGLAMIDAGSQSKVDDVVTALVKAFDGLVLSQVQTKITPQSAMTGWLASATPDEDWPEGFNIERECELRSADEEKSVVRFTRHRLQNDEVRKHITEGKLPTRLALTWEDRVSMVLTDSMQLKKLNFLEGVFKDQSADKANDFDADVALSTGEISRMIPALLSARGGEASLQPDLSTREQAAPSAPPVHV